MRKEGLYSTLIRKWRLQAARDAGGADVVARPGPKPDLATRDMTKARSEIERLNTELASGQPRFPGYLAPDRSFPSSGPCCRAGA